MDIEQVSQGIMQRNGDETMDKQIEKNQSSAEGMQEALETKMLIACDEKYIQKCKSFLTAEIIKDLKWKNLTPDIIEFYNIGFEPLRNMITIPLDENTIFLKAYTPDNLKEENWNELLKLTIKGKAIIELKKASAYNHIAEFLNGIKASVNTPAIPTGFKELDNALEGGLYEGLYILGAISSLGKTSFILQIGDQIAQNGTDVIIFSLEMARFELMAKSISRHTYLNCNGKIQNAKTIRGITSGIRQELYNPEEKMLIHKSIGSYTEYNSHIYIYESYENEEEIGTKQINSIIDRHIKIKRNNPVVIIDYLQIIEPFDLRLSDKQNTDKAVKTLKRITRKNKIPIIAISSLNRASYKEEIGMEAFKESGAIEYSSDVLIGLQFQHNGQINNATIDREKCKDTRKIELKILKQRNGKTGQKINFDYLPMFNYFAETGISAWAPEDDRNLKQMKKKSSEEYKQTRLKEIKKDGRK